MFHFAYRDLDYSHKLDRASSPEDEYWKHMHAFNEIVFFVSGKVDYTVESKTKRLQPGDVISIKAGKLHFASVDKGVDYERYVLKFPDNVIPAYLKANWQSLNSFLRGPEYLETIFKNFDLYFANRDFTSDDLRTICLSLTDQLLVFLSHNRGSELSLSNSLASDIIFYIESHLKNKISLKEISAALNYSQSYLVSTFKKNMHCSLVQYIRSKKCILADKMIKEGGKPQEVAESLGFGEYSTFYRSFRSVLGFSPSQAKEESAGLENGNGEVLRPKNK